LIGKLGWELANLPLERIVEAKQMRCFILFGILIRYLSKDGQVKTIKFYTYRYKRWAQAFEVTGITVKPYRDVFDWFEGRRSTASPLVL
jgi:hypothetical protein